MATKETGTITEEPTTNPEEIKAVTPIVDQIYNGVCDGIENYEAITDVITVELKKEIENVLTAKKDSIVAKVIRRSIIEAGREAKEARKREAALKMLAELKAAGQLDEYLAEVK